MRKFLDSYLYSASDIVNFSQCGHITSLDRIHLDTPLEKAEDDEQAELIKKKGLEHEARYLAQLKQEGLSIRDLTSKISDPSLRALETTNAMRDGADVIFQATLFDAPFMGIADFLRKVERPSALGSYSYEVVDTKLALTAKSKFLIQLSFYSELLGKAQGVAPESMHVVLGDGSEQSFRVCEYLSYFRMLKSKFLGELQVVPSVNQPEPCAACGLCVWRDRCNADWIKSDHLSQVAGITKMQIVRLRAAGIVTLEALAKLSPGQSIQSISPDSLQRVRQQARLQFEARIESERKLEILPQVAERLSGFARLPRPNMGDMYFDMEGDPLESGGLEYLFGVYYVEGGVDQFKPFWACEKAGERAAFEAFIDFAVTRLRQYPDAHIYHYAPYEETALKRLMTLYASREVEIDDWLRGGKLIDLYKVVRESIRTSEPGYSIKNIEKFYMDAREGEVQTAGASIVKFERWKETGDGALLTQIENYNRDDCRSTYLLHQWLLGYRPSELPWRSRIEGEDEGASTQKSEKTRETEAELGLFYKALVTPLPVNRATWGPSERLNELAFFLLDFHRRQAKPAYWALFDRMDVSDEELIEDIECIGAAQRDNDSPPVTEGRSVKYTYRFPPQETKLKSGDEATLAATAKSLRALSVDPENRIVSFKTTAKEPLPELISIGPGAPFRDQVIRDAVRRFAQSVADRSHRYSAIESLLRRDFPKVNGYTVGASFTTVCRSALDQSVEVVKGLQQSYMFIQGPPGAGKTYTGSHIIVSLIEAGFRVGVSSNSHKAIHNLLDEVEAVSKQRNVTFEGIKKASSGNDESVYDGQFIGSSGDVKAIARASCQLVAGTAWLFSDEVFDQKLDYLFVDEAGQVSLANLVAIGTSAKNIVLLGDQMQLGQPIQGTHPGESGESSLEYLLEGQGTIPSNRGIFLATTYRLHEDVCRFISDAVYDGRLEPEPANQQQKLLLDSKADSRLKQTGIRYIPAEHDGCKQASAEEVQVVSDLYANLLSQHYQDKSGNRHRMGTDNILVVAPYNMQVNLLRKSLPAGARVGTVDKFQGQEAEVVLISMATSSEDYLPRNIEFLFSKNRLNVAISRARCLAVLIANPALLAISCRTPEQMALVNTMCWLREYSASLDS